MYGACDFELHHLSRSKTLPFRTAQPSDACVDALLNGKCSRKGAARPLALVIGSTFKYVRNATQVRRSQLRSLLNASSRCGDQLIRATLNFGTFSFSSCSGKAQSFMEMPSILANHKYLHARTGTR